MINENNKIISKILERDFDKSLEITVSSMIFGKKDALDELAEFLEQDEDGLVKRYISAIDKGLEDSEKQLNLVSAVLEMVTTTVNNQSYKLAKRFIQNLSNALIKAKIYLIIADNLENNNLKEKSLQCIEKAMIYAEKTKNKNYKAELRGDLAKLFLRRKEYNAAIKLLKTIKIDSYTSVTIETFLTFVMVEKDQAQKKMLIIELSKIAETIKNDELKSKSFITITKAMLKENMIYEALELARQIKDQKVKISTLGVIIELMAKSGKKWEAQAIVGEARSAVDNIKSSDKCESISEVIEAQIKLDMVDEAISISNDVKDAGWKAMNMTVIAEAMAKNSHQTKALTILENALSLVKNIESFGAKSTVLSSVAEAISIMDDADERKLEPIFDTYTDILKRIKNNGLASTILIYMKSLGLIKRHKYFKEKLELYINELNDEKLKNHLTTIIE